MANETNKLSFGGVDYLLEDHRISSIVDAIYPVGSIYMSVNNASPATLFGGTWEQIQDTFLLAAGQTYTAGATGGEAAHTLSYSEMPEHAHYSMGKTAAENGDWTYPLMKSVPSYAGAWGFNLDTENADYVAYAARAVDGHGYPDVTQVAYTGASGDGQAHNNMPPYLAVYVWKRTA